MNTQHTQKIVKLVKGNNNSIRVTIPKQIVNELNLTKNNYVSIQIDDTNRITITPVTVIKEKTK